VTVNQYGYGMRIPNLTGTEMIDVKGRSFKDLFYYKNYQNFGLKKFGVVLTISHITEIHFLF